MWHVITHPGPNFNDGLTKYIPWCYVGVIIHPRRNHNADLVNLAM